MIEKSILSNGICVVSEKIPYFFSATVGLWVKVGSRDEEFHNSGVSHFIEHMLFKGTSQRSTLNIAKEIDRLGGQVNAFTSKESTCFYARVLTNRLPDLCDLLADLLIHSRYEESEIERERQVILQEISCQEDTPDDLIHSLFNRNFWFKHPLGRPILGVTESVMSIDRSLLLKYQMRHYHPKNIVVSAVGNFEHKYLVELIDNVFGKMSVKTFFERRIPPEVSPGIHLFLRPLEQVHIVLGYKSFSAMDSRRYSVAILNLILGGSMSSRLFQEVREKRGLAYSVYSFFNTYADSGVLGLYLGVSPNRVSEALKVVYGEVEKLISGFISSEEVEDAKESLIDSLLLSEENSESRMFRLARNEINFGFDVALKETISAIKNIDKNEIFTLASQLLIRESVSLAVLGEVEEIF